jgi:hypothetical protein
VRVRTRGIKTSWMNMVPEHVISIIEVGGLPGPIVLAPEHHGCADATAGIARNGKR